MSDEQTLYISPEDDLTTVRERLEQIQSKRITLVIPAQTQLRSHVAWKLLYVRARELGKDVLIVSSDPQVRSVAHAVKFKVANSLESPSLAGKSRSGGPSRVSRSPVRSRYPSGGPASRIPGTKNPPESRGARNVAEGGQKKPTRPIESSWLEAEEHIRATPPIEDLGMQSTPGAIRESFQESSPSSYPLPSTPSFSSRATPYEQPSASVPSIRPLPPEQIEEPDLLIEDYEQAQNIRLAAQEGQKRSNISNVGSSIPSLSEEFSEPPTIHQTNKSRIENDPFTYLEDSEIPPGMEQRGKVIPGQHSDIEDVDDLSPEILGEDIDDLPPPPITLQQPSPEVNEISVRPHGVRPRQSRSGYLVSRTPQAKEPTEIPFTPPESRRPSKGLRPSQELRPQSIRPSQELRPQSLRPSQELRVPQSIRPSKELQSSRALHPSQPLQSQRPALRASGSLIAGAKTIKETTNTRSRQTIPTIDRDQVPPPPPSRGSGSLRTGASRKPAAIDSRKPPTRGNRATFVALSIAIAIILILAILAYVVPTAEVQITVASEPYSQNLTLRANLQGQDQMIQAERVTKEFERTGTATATDEKEVGTQPAQGQVFFTNGTENPILIPTGTRITTTSNPVITFETTAEVIIQPASSEIDPIAVTIKAVESGETGNVPANTITNIPDESIENIVSVQDYQTTAEDLDLTVTNENPTSGGGVKPVPAIKQEDLDKATKELREQLQGEIDTWRKQISPLGLTGSLKTEQNLLNPPDPGQTVENKTFPVKIKVIASVILVKEEALQQKAIEQLNTDIGKNKDFEGKNYQIFDDPSTPLKFTDVKTKEIDENTLEIALKANGNAGPFFSKEEIQRNVSGKTVGDATNLLQNISGITNVKINVSPAVPWVTPRMEQITVTIKPQT